MERSEPAGHRMTTATSPRLRAVLQVPGADPEALAAAAGTQADRVLLDLDDTVAPADKARARALVVAAIAGTDWGHRSVAVRVNAPFDPQARHDLVEVLERTGERVDAIVVPRVSTPGDVVGVEWLIEQIERDVARQLPVRLEVQLETAAALVHAHAIVATSPRIASVAVGPGDLAADLELPLLGHGGDPRRLVMDQARLTAVLVARAAGILALDGPGTEPAAEFASRCAFARGIGMHGTWCVSEEQVRVARDCFRPAAAELEHARQSLDGGSGYDAALVRAAERTLAAAD